MKLPRSSPESQGVSPDAVQSFIKAAETRMKVIHSFMLLRHGRVLAEKWWPPEGPEKRHIMYSLSKSFTSTAAGLAIQEKKLSLDDLVLEAFKDKAPAEPSDNLKAMRLRDLLTMTCGHQTELKWMEGMPRIETFLSHPVEHKPGTHFLYNTPGTYMVSAMVQKAVGQTVLEYLGPRLFGPLGIEAPEWGTKDGVTIGGTGLHVRTEDIAKFGQVYLQKGKWEGKQLVPASWIELATSRQTSNGSSPDSDWDQGYGFQFWRCRHGAFRGDGMKGQFCVVLPAQDAVVVMTADHEDMQLQLNLVWEFLLPAFRP